MRKIIAGLDVGSENIKLIVAESIKGRIHVLGVSCVSSLGIKRGFVVDPNALLSKLQEVFSKCEDMLGLKVSKVVISVPSDDTSFMMMEGSTSIHNDEHIISQNDVIRAMQASTYNQIEENQEIVFLEPVSFVIDDERTVKNPIGQEGIKLTVKSLLATVPRKNIYAIVKCLERLGITVVDYTLGAIGDYKEAEKPMMREVAGAIINIGYQTTTVAIFHKGLLTNISILNVGAINVEHDLSYMFGLQKSDAKVVKRTLASAHKRGVSASVHKDFTTKEGKTVTISEYEASEVASSRLEEILKLAKKEINLLTKKEIHYIMITGGVSEMANFSLLVEEIFGHQAKIINIRELGVRSNIYSTALGLIKYYDEKTRTQGVDFSIFNDEEIEELSNVNKRINFGENSILGKLFGYFFDN